MSGEETVVGASAYPYAHEVLVEVTCRDEDDHLVVYSYPFDPDEDGTAVPVDTVPERHCQTVTDALAEKDYEPKPDLTSPP